MWIRLCLLAEIVTKGPNQFSKRLFSKNCILRIQHGYILQIHTLWNLKMWFIYLQYFSLVRSLCKPFQKIRMQSLENKLLENWIVPLFTISTSRQRWIHIHNEKICSYLSFQNAQTNTRKGDSQIMFIHRIWNTFISESTDFSFELQFWHMFHI